MLPSSSRSGEGAPIMTPQSVVITWVRSFCGAAPGNSRSADDLDDAGHGADELDCQVGADLRGAGWWQRPSGLLPDGGGRASTRLRRLIRPECSSQRRLLAVVRRGWGQGKGDEE